MLFLQGKGSKDKDMVIKKPFQSKVTSIIGLVLLMLLLAAGGAWASNSAIFPLLIIVAFMVGFGSMGYSGTSISPHYSPEDKWDNETKVRVFSYTFAPFVGALITTNIGSYIFEGAWSALGILRWFFILLGEITVVLLVRKVRKIRKS